MGKYKGKVNQEEKPIRKRSAGEETDPSFTETNPSAGADDEKTPLDLGPPSNQAAEDPDLTPPGPSPPADQAGAGGDKHFKKEETTVNTRIISPEQAAALEAEDDHPDSLVLLAGPHEFIGFCWPIEKFPSTAGRSRRLADIVIPHASVSKKHFQIERRGETLSVTDLKSTNHTWLNKQKLIPFQPEPLNNNDQIKAGAVIFKFLARGDIELFSSRHILNQAYVDSLTGAANRKALERRGPEFFREKEGFCLILFDVDRFKIINDTYGHLAGDFVLQVVCELIRGLVREGDMLFRYGGDEFCIFSAQELKTARNTAGRIRQAVEAHSFEYKGQKMQVTVSLGLAARQAEDKRWEDVYERADKAFYRAKKAGRNCVEAASAGD